MVSVKVSANYLLQKLVRQRNGFRDHKTGNHQAKGAQENQVTHEVQRPIGSGSNRV